ncbi:LOW QUALITY PROTEIN: inhibitor of nuclear factor kappa-B kinase-interacting protein-like [Megalobrama amblycephala]|uniref:LOW QUALITY PROTEIN: inhibitor of nuclear factor kappa-B kinase-interacting protein-like n=1 Tax=Megalobrama amblycephala TaxID=75352 RepID=UPI00201454E2|nr:LOW QUALITY PROTEIN: inhibitor of nuclear factor kappa-B kinase-interacting protein-like [Megalobrama amblycephala]
MQNSDLKQRQKSSNRQQNGEKRSAAEEKKKKEADKREGFSPDAKLCVSLICLALSLLITWLHLQQSAKLAEMTGKCEFLQEKSRSVQELDDKLTQVSHKLQASADGATLLLKLKHALGSVLNTSAALQAEQEASSDRLQALHLRFQSASDQLSVSDELHTLKTQSRAAHGHVTEHINDIDGRLRELSERLKEVQDGTRRNARVLDRTEEEDAQRVREQTDWNGRRVSRLQEQLEQLAAQGRGLQEKLESRAPHAQDTQLAAAEEAVRSMLRVRAHVSATHRRVQELEQQVRSTEDQMRETRSQIRDLRPASQEEI